MAYFGKTYTLVSQENFDSWLRASGLPEDKIASIVSQKPWSKIVQNGDSYTFTQSSPKGDKQVTFKSGVEFDDTIGDDDTPIKSTATVSGNTITQVVKTPLGAATFKREYNGDDLVVTITSDKFDGVAKRYYKA